MRRHILAWALCNLVALSLMGQYAHAGLRADRAKIRQQKGIKPMVRSNKFRWSILQLHNVPTAQRENWRVKTLGFDAMGNTVIKAINRKTRESFLATAKVDGHYIVNKIDNPNGLVRVLHTSAYRKAFIKASGVNTPSEYFRKNLSMTTIAVTAKGESIMAVSAPRTANMKTNQVVVKGSYTTNAAGKITGVKAKILSDQQLKAHGLFTLAEQMQIVGQSSKGAVYRKVDGKVGAPYGVRGRKKSARFKQRTDKTFVRKSYGNYVEIIPAGRRIDRYFNLLTGQETAINPDMIMMTTNDIAAAHAELFGGQQ